MSIDTGHTEYKKTDENGKPKPKKKDEDKVAAKNRELLEKLKAERGIKQTVKMADILNNQK